MSEDAVTIDRIRQVKQAYEGQLLKLANVVGVGIGLRQQGGVRTGNPVLVVMVRKKFPTELLAQTDLIPSEIEGVPVDVQEVGDIQAYS
ncbi:MAG: hypothetical protein A2W33_06015 [Chloroflexi bacterium RBG_16_52_11]|nr:MAG: hypothetical protein A2W33_06015 [Chloroflexi bacterium RBG_16_52_11]